MKFFGKTSTQKQLKQETKEKNFATSDSRWGWFHRFIPEAYPGAWQQNVELGIESILMHPIVYGCVNTISSDIAKLRPRLMDQLPSGIWRERYDNKISPVLKKPNHYQNHLQYKELYMNSKLSCGNTYVLIQRDRSRDIEKLFILDPALACPVISDSGEVFYRLKADKLSGIHKDNLNLDLMQFEGDLYVPASEIIHDRWNCFNHPLIGIGPLQAAMLTATHALRIQRHGSTFFANSAMMSGVLTAPGHISDDTANRAKDYFEEEFTGAGAGKIAVLGDGLKYEQMTMSSADSQLIEQMKYTGEQICSIFHVPQHMILGNSPTYNNIEIMNQQYYSQCLQILIESFEELHDQAFGLNNKNKNNSGIDLDLSSIMRMDTTTRYSTYDKGIKGSFLTINEARLMEDLEPVEGGDTIRLQQQNFSLQALAERDKTNPLGVPPSTEKPQEVVDAGKEEENQGDDEEDTTEDETEKFIKALTRQFKGGQHGF